ncbi:MAG: hypothetical protein R3F30_12690 [Planctomycetota bacterium]
MRRLALLAALALASCRGSTTVLDVDWWARFPPLPYRVVLAGGAVMSETDAAEPETPAVDPAEGKLLLAKTFVVGDREPLPFADLCATLRAGRAASDLLVLGEDDFATRAATAEASARGLDLDPQVGRAEAMGADILLVLEGVDESPIIVTGTTGSWPIATVVWLLVGLGGLVPETRFESRATLRASLRDVHTGRRLALLSVQADPMDLSLFQRAGFFKILTHIIIPPPLVGSDGDVVGPRVREEVARQLGLKLLARLKSQDLLENLRAGLDFRLELKELQGRVLQVEVSCPQEVQTVLVEVDGKLFEGEGLERFRQAFFRSKRSDPRLALFRYQAALDGLPDGALVRVLVETLAGDRVSSTLRVGRP